MQLRITHTHTQKHFSPDTFRPLVNAGFLPQCHPRCFFWLSLPGQNDNILKFIRMTNKSRVFDTQGRQRGRKWCDDYSRKKSGDSSEAKTDVKDEAGEWEWWSDKWKRMKMKLWKTMEQQDEGNKPERDIIQTSQTIQGPCVPVLLPEAGVEELFWSFYRVLHL